MEKLEKRFRNKKGYKILIYLNETPEEIFGKPIPYYSIYIYYKQRLLNIGKQIISSWGDENRVGYAYYLKDIEEVTKRIKNKTARRYFLREIRKFKLGSGTFLDYMKSNKCSIDWDKVNSIDESLFEKWVKEYESENGLGSWPKEINNFKFKW